MLPFLPIIRLNLLSAINNDLPNTTQKTKDREKRTQLKSGVNLGALEEWAVPAPLVAPVVLL